MANEKKSWRRSLAEVGSIVGSILLAFFIDASWASHRERLEEQQILRSLEADFAENGEILEATRQSHDGIRQRGAALLDSIAVFRQSGRLPTVAALVLRQTDWETYDPVEGTLESLIGSGHLDLVESDALRAALVAWPDQVADLNEDEELLRASVREQLLPLVFRHVSMAALQQASETGQGLDQETRRGLTALLGSIEFANWVRDQVEWRVYLLGEAGDLRALEASLSATQQLIEGEKDD